ncbi:unnamed protein product, partial [Mesorhabditis belari]|uniref:Rho-GAP domain-containing protein n=1 Tax=Mesorhabditis belari TaxID=2138241 RepID=A0AAF3F2H3_9BILA
MMIVSEIPYTEEYIEASCSQQKSDSIQLGSLRCYNINIQVEVEKIDKHTKGMTTLTLREVPKFLVDAFNIIRSNIDKEGLFRKGGNSARINSFSRKLTAIYSGREIIPPELNCLDVCSLIKSFIKTLKIPLLYNHEMIDKLIDLVKQKDAGKEVNGDDVQELFRPQNIMNRETMPEAHIGTLGFLMRELYRVSLHNEKNGMTIQNLATCFGPTLFDMSPGAVKKSAGPLRVPNGMGSMDEAKQTSQRAAAAVAILIERATWIGLHRECYVSSQARSSSAAPLHRTPLSQLQPALDKRPSLPISQHDPAIAKVQNDQRGRRSNSLALQGIYNLFRGRRKSTERVSHFQQHLVPRKRDLSADSSTPRANKFPGIAGHQSRSRIRDSPQRDKVEVNLQDVQSRRKTYARQPTPGPGGSSSQKKATLSATGEAETPRSQRLMRTSTHSKEKTPHGPPRLLDFDAFDAAEQPRITRSQTKAIAQVAPYKDLAISMLEPTSEINPTKKKERRRRHTTPVKGNVLRRHHPNTVANGLPRRRVTQAITAEEKENVMKRRSHSVEDVEESTGDSADDILDAKKQALRKMMEFDPRPRKTKRLRRRETMTIVETTTATVHASTSPTLPRAANTFEKKEVKRGEPQSISALTVTTSSLHLSKSPMGVRAGNEKDLSDSQVSPNRIMQVTPMQSPVIVKGLSTGNHPNAVSVVSVVARHMAIPAIVHERSGGQINVVVEPEIECTRSTRPRSPYPLPMAEREEPFESTPESLAKARSTIIHQLSFDSFRVPKIPGLSRQSATRVPHSPGSSSLRSPTTSELPVDVARAEPTQTTSPFTRKGVSASVLDRRHFGTPKSISRQRSADEFGHSEHYRNVIVSASSTSELDMGDGFDSRPSVAFIAQNRRGLVRDRVNQFGGGNASMISTGRASVQSNHSQRSSSNRFSQFDSPTFYQ